MDKVYFSKEKKLPFAARIKEDSEIVVLTFVDADGDPFDISSYDWKFRVSKKPYAGTLFTLELGSGLTISGAGNNLLSIEITAEQATVKPNSYYGRLFDDDNTWLAGEFEFFETPRDSETGETITITEEGTPVTVTISAGGVADESVFTSDPTLILSSGFTFGKYSNGDTPAWTGLTAIEAILDAIIDYIDPAFTSFSVSGQASTVEVGTTISGSKTFLWTISVGSGTVPTIDIYDITLGANLIAGTANDGTQVVTVTSLQLNSNGATQQWRGVGNNTSPAGTFNSNTVTVTARFYRFFGPSASSPANSAEVRALPSSAFQTGGSFVLATGTAQTKFVVALPPGVTITSVIDTSAFDADITSEYVLTGTISVLDAGGTSRTYNLYEMNIGAPYSSSHNHQITTS